MTSAQLAEMVGLSHDFILQIESEKVRYNFSVDTFYKISVALGVGMDMLAENETDGEIGKTKNRGQGEIAVTCAAHYSTYFALRLDTQVS